MKWFRDLTLPIEASTVARDIDNLYIFMVLLSAFFFFLIAGLIAFFLMRYRRKGPNDITPHITHNLNLEIAWSVLPLLICLVVFFWGFNGFVRANVAPGNSMEIQVTAKKWQWQFEYPDGTRTINDIHVPIGKPVRLVMTSEDVLHSFFVPAFRVKHDIVPGRYTEVYPLTVLPCRDGHVALGVVSDAEFDRMAIVMGHPEWSLDPRFAVREARWEHRPEMDTALAKFLVRRRGPCIVCAAESMV